MLSLLKCHSACCLQIWNAENDIFPKWSCCSCSSYLHRVLSLFCSNFQLYPALIRTAWENRTRPRWCTSVSFEGWQPPAVWHHYERRQPGLKVTDYGFLMRWNAFKWEIAHYFCDISVRLNKAETAKKNSTEDSQQRLTTGIRIHIGLSILATVDTLKLRCQLCLI